MSRTRLTWAILALSVIGLVGFVAFGGDPETDAERAQRLARSLACPECVGESVAASNSSTARRMREIIQEEIDAGSSDADIRARLFATYRDEKIFLEPNRRGLGLVVWALPFAALVIGAVAIYIALRRWSRTPRLVSTATDEDLVARLREEPR